MPRKKGDTDKVESGYLKLSDLPRRLKQESGIRTTYTQCYNAVVSGDIPAERSETGGRWLLKEQDIPVIIQNFSLLKED